jgi:hypothetical protein
MLLLIFVGQIQNIQTIIATSNVFSRIDLPQLKKLSDKVFNKEQKKLLDAYSRKIKYILVLGIVQNCISLLK